MVKINAQPLSEVNGVKFGMKREAVRQMLGEAREFKKSKFSKTTTDDFGYCHVFYDINDKCEAVEIFVGSEVSVNGKIIFPTSIEGAKEIVPDLNEDNGSFISISKSIGIYAPSGNMESILFGVSGYYN